jgi:hypothetical protein
VRRAAEQLSAAALEQQARQPAAELAAGGTGHLGADHGGAVRSGDNS